MHTCPITQTFAGEQCATARVWDALAAMQTWIGAGTRVPNGDLMGYQAAAFRQGWFQMGGSLCQPH
jgi:hypothetical protein